jgi:hypothetical protein
MKNIALKYSIVIFILVLLSTYVYLKWPASVVLRDLDIYCNHDERHYTIMEVIKGRKDLHGELVLPRGEEFYDLVQMHKIDTTTEVVVEGSYSIFSHSQIYAGCTGSHYLNIHKIISINKIKKE